MSSRKALWRAFKAGYKAALVARGERGPSPEELTEASSAFTQFMRREADQEAARG